MARQKGRKKKETPKKHIKKRLRKSLEEKYGFKLPKRKAHAKATGTADIHKKDAKERYRKTHPAIETERAESRWMKNEEKRKLTQMLNDPRGYGKDQAFIRKPQNLWHD